MDYFLGCNKNVSIHKSVINDIVQEHRLFNCGGGCLAAAMAAVFSACNNLINNVAPRSVPSTHSWCVGADSDDGTRVHDFFMLIDSVLAVSYVSWTS